MLGASNNPSGALHVRGAHLFKLGGCFSNEFCGCAPIEFRSCDGSVDPRGNRPVLR
jgi:hypothetical protein